MRYGLLRRSICRSYFQKSMMTLETMTGAKTIEGRKTTNAGTIGTAGAAVAAGSDRCPSPGRIIQA